MPRRWTWTCLCCRTLTNCNPCRIWRCHQMACSRQRKSRTWQVYQLLGSAFATRFSHMQAANSALTAGRCSKGSKSEMYILAGILQAKKCRGPRSCSRSSRRSCLPPRRCWCSVAIYMCCNLSIMCVFGKSLQDSTKAGSCVTSVRQQRHAFDRLMRFACNYTAGGQGGAATEEAARERRAQALHKPCHRQDRWNAGFQQGTHLIALLMLLSRLSGPHGCQKTRLVAS